MKDVRPISDTKPEDKPRETRDRETRDKEIESFRHTLYGYARFKDIDANPKSTEKINRYTNHLEMHFDMRSTQLELRAEELNRNNDRLEHNSNFKIWEVWKARKSLRESHEEHKVLADDTYKSYKQTTMEEAKKSLDKLV